MKHGDPPAPPTLELLTHDDPDLWLVLANLSVWARAHPCECEALCECDGDER